MPMYQKFLDFLSEAKITIDELEKRLNALNLGKLRRDSSRTISIITDLNRMDVLERVVNEFSDLDAYHDPNKTSSSIGAVVAGVYTIRARPANKQGRRSAGIENEQALIDQITYYTKGGPFHVRFTDGKKKYTFKHVIGIEDVSRDTAQRKKADVVLLLEDGRKIPISIKKDGAEMWESADTYWAPYAKKLIDREEKKGKVKITPKNNVFFMSPNLAVKANKEEIKDVVFGTDILGEGFVAVKTFMKKDFVLVDDGYVLEVRVTKIIDSMNDLKGPYEVYFLIRNDSSRKGSRIRPGLRVLAVSATRINKNVRVVTR